MSPANGLACADGADATEFMLLDDGFGSGRVLMLVDGFALAGAAKGSDMVLAPVAMEGGGAAGREVSELSSRPATSLIRLVDLSQWVAGPGLHW